MAGGETIRSERRHQPAGMRRQQILEAAMVVFSRDGFHKTDVEKIAALAGVGKGTVYRHFGNKEGLFLALIEWGLDSLQSEIREAVVGIDNAIAKIEAALKTYLAFFERNRTFYRVLIQERDKFGETLKQRFRKRHLSHLHLLEEALKTGMEQGVIKETDAHSAAMALLGMTNSLIFRWLVLGEEYSLEDEQAIILEIFFRGIAQRRD